MISMAGKAIRKWWALFALPTFAAFIIGFVIPFIMGVYLSFCKFTTNHLRPHHMGNSFNLLHTSCSYINTGINLQQPF